MPTIKPAERKTKTDAPKGIASGALALEADHKEVKNELTINLPEP